jgi:hypothetical protein
MSSISLTMYVYIYTHTHTQTHTHTHTHMFLCCFLLPNAVCPQHLLSWKHACLYSPFILHALCYELHLPQPLDELQTWLELSPTCGKIIPGLY